MRKPVAALLLALLLPACGDDGADALPGVVLDAVLPASPSSSQLPAFHGRAAPGALVELYANPAGTGAPSASGTAGSSGAFELVASVARPSQRTYYAFATPPRAPRSGPSNGILYASRLGGFQPLTSFAVGTQPILLASGDFNGDTKLDLAVPGASGNDVTILLGTGTGAFTPGVAPPGIGSGAAGIAAADFDGDLDLDLAVSNSNANTLSILLGNGDGTFTPAAGSPLAVGTTPYEVRAGLLNADGNIDLAVANFGDDSVSVLLGNGDGSFSPAAGNPISVGNGPFAAVVADVNGGPLDLLVANFLGSGLSILLGNGDGTFTPAAVSPVPAAGQASTPAAADLDGDGRLDVAVPRIFTASALPVFLGDGAGGFSAGPGTVPATGSEPIFAGAADFNGDGRLDLVSSDRSSDQLSFFLGAGAGAFGTGTPLAVGDGPFGQVIADFNGDGVPDVAVVCQGANRVDVLLGR